MLGFYICILFSTALTLPLPFRTMQNIQQERKTTLVISKLFRSTVSFKITRKHRPCRYPILYYFFFHEYAIVFNCHLLSANFIYAMYAIIVINLNEDIVQIFDRERLSSSSSFSLSIPST